MVFKTISIAKLLPKRNEWERETYSFALERSPLCNASNKKSKPHTCHGSQGSRVDERREKSKRQGRKWLRFSWLRGGECDVMCVRLVSKTK